MCTLDEPHEIQDMDIRYQTTHNKLKAVHIPEFQGGDYNPIFFML